MPRTGHCVRKSAALAQLVRALDCGSRGPLFKPGRRYHHTNLVNRIFYSGRLNASEGIKNRHLWPRLPVKRRSSDFGVFRTGCRTRPKIRCSCPRGGCSRHRPRPFWMLGPGSDDRNDRAGKTDLYQFLHAQAPIPFGRRDCRCARSPSKISGAFNREQIVPLRDWGHDRQSGLFRWLVATAQVREFWRSVRFPDEE